MAFRKLKYKNVQGSRSTSSLRPGEIAVDEVSDTFYIGDGVTTGGNAVRTNNTYVVDADGGAIDFTKDVVFVTAGQSYTLADGDTIGHVLNLVVSGGTTGAITVTVANSKHIGSGNVITNTAYAWALNGAAGITNTMATRRCIWDGTHWVLDNA